MVFTRWSRVFDVVDHPAALAIRAAFGVSPYMAIPQPYRPKTGLHLTVPLVIDLSNLAARVSDLDDFRQLLVRARERRQVEHGSPLTESSIQSSDVLLAIDLLAEDARLQPQVGTYDDEVEVEVEDDEVEVEDEGEDEDDEENSLPIQRGVRKVNTPRPVASSPRLSIAAPQSPRGLKRRGRTTDVSPRKNRHVSRDSASSFEEKLPLTSTPTMSTMRPQRRPRDTTAITPTPDRPIKKPSPNIIRNLLDITDFDALEYPALVVSTMTSKSTLENTDIAPPIPGKPGEFLECDDAEDARELKVQQAEKAKRRTSTISASKRKWSPTSSIRVTVEQGDDDSEVKEENDMTHEDEEKEEVEGETASSLGLPTTIKHPLDDQVQNLSDSMITVCATATAARTSMKLSRAQQEGVERLYDVFVRKFMDAKESYEDGLRSLGILDDEEYQETQQDDSKEFPGLNATPEPHEDSVHSSEIETGQIQGNGVDMEEPQGSTPTFKTETTTSNFE
ncbi:hypothetical protein K505DRAFT_364924 [Melanomma pulvis-pyrius CBS 109.77]|uniref:Uncharacterized protein n=1 Tax=Melanomma pulvis-pyrius CBS 109.77 TaxID=1314802 RepID=A0A6A6X1K7_9PLEO|nr:hypothetical protein K505DRAFT_364924 [Melanomma pulvis-pyrius CBS 109.77]